MEGNFGQICPYIIPDHNSELMNKNQRIGYKVFWQKQFTFSFYVMPVISNTGNLTVVFIGF